MTIEAGPPPSDIGASDIDAAGIGDPTRYPYGSPSRCHLQHVHLFASDIDATIAFYRRWFDAEVAWDGDYAGARNVFMKIGIGAIHLYDQKPRGAGRNAVHHLGMQVVGLDDLYARMIAAGVPIRNPVRHSHAGGGYFMLEAPDGVLLEVFEPGPQREPVVRRYYGLDADASGTNNAGSATESS